MRWELEVEGKRLDERDLRIALIVLARGLTLITGNVRRFGHVPEDWLGG